MATEEGKSPPGYPPEGEMGEPGFNGQLVRWTPIDYMRGAFVLTACLLVLFVAIASYFAFLAGKKVDEYLKFILPVVTYILGVVTPFLFPAAARAVANRRSGGPSGSR